MAHSPRGAGERVQDQVAAVPGAHGAVGLGDIRVQCRGLRRGVQPRLGRDPVHDLVGDTHHGVDVAHVLAMPRAEKPGGETERVE